MKPEAFPAWNFGIRSCTRPVLLSLSLFRVREEHKKKGVLFSSAGGGGTK